MSKGPLIRLALIRIAEDAYYFVWTHHHMVMDGWSAALLLQEALEFAGEGLVKATIHRDKLDNINQIFEQMRAGQIEGRIVVEL